MNISDFTEQQVDEIVAEWVAFARKSVPETGGLSFAEVADHARVLLMAIAADIRCSQGAQATHDKSHGEAEERAPEITRIARAHAEQRFAQGFSLDHLLAEFRALRACVIRRWAGELEPVTRERFVELTRFGEAMDQALTESVSLYSAKVDDARNLLLGVLGHDLRTPLGAVHLTADLLLHTRKLDPAQTESVARILRSAERMRAMVNDLLDFTQTALGVPLPVSPSPADLGQLAEHIVREVSTVYPDSRITESHEGDLTGHWDPERIGQMFSNLIGNAVQHGLHGRPVSVRVSAEGDSAVVRIRNEGAPIPVEAQKTLFSPLRQAAGAQPSTHAGSSGLGLGLYITREIAVAHGGSVEVSSADGFVTFCVRLPRKPPASARLGAPSAGNAGSGSPH